MAKNIGLGVASVALLWALLEGVAWLLLPMTPLRLQAYLPGEIAVLAQSSKRGTRPADYVALCGDSYAQGLGDWLLEADPDRNPPFHSAHVLNERSGRDVVTFGRGGAGAVRGVFTGPVGAVRALARSWLHPVGPPADLIVYFYEGNDLSDTLAELLYLGLVEERPELSATEREARVWLLLAGREQTGSAYRRALEERALWTRPSDLADAMRAAVSREAGDDPPGILHELYLARFAAAALSAGRAPGAGAPDRESPQGWDYERWTPVDLGGQVAEVPQLLQGPATELSRRETEIALAAFEAALGLLRETLPTTHVCVVQVPSPASSYRFLADEIRSDGLRRGLRVSVAAARERSRTLGERLAEIAARQGSRFVDAGPGVRQRASQVLVHGPLDWRHFNRAGYTALAEAALACLE